jgi:replicative DNA helicase
MARQQKEYQKDLYSQDKVNIPHDLEAEKELLGMLIRDNNNIDYIDFLRSDHFYYPVYSDIFAAIVRIVEQHKPADISFIYAQLESNPVFIDLGGKQLLHDIVGTISFSTAKDRGYLIYNLFLKRQLMLIGQEMVADATSSGLLEIKDRIAATESKLYQIASHDGEKSFRQLSATFGDILNRLDIARHLDKPVTGLSTGLIDLDLLIGGLKKSDLIILAARPSMGKTALAVNMAYSVAKLFDSKEAEGGVALFSLEMSTEQIALRIIANHSNINARVFETGRSEHNGKINRLSNSDFEDIAKMLGDLNKLPLFIDDTPAITIAQLHTRARRLKKKHNISAIFIDYLQLIRGSSNGSQVNRVQEVSEVTQGLKAMAKELNVPVIALSQLSRAVETRDDKHPQLSDLRESGSIEQDADIVMFLYREAYYLERQKPEEAGQEPSIQDQEAWTRWRKLRDKEQQWQQKCEAVANLAEIIVAKNRNGSIGHADVSFDREKTKFGNRAKDVPLVSTNQPVNKYSTSANYAKAMGSGFSQASKPPPINAVKFIPNENINTDDMGDLVNVFSSHNSSNWADDIIADIENGATEQKLNDAPWED